MGAITAAVRCVDRVRLHADLTILATLARARAVPLIAQLFALSPFANGRSDSGYFHVRFASHRTQEFCLSADLSDEYEQIRVCHDPTPLPPHP
jgi:hypothetical protein